MVTRIRLASLELAPRVPTVQEEEGYKVCGNCIGIDHGHGVVSIFMHLNTVDAAVGQRFTKGDVIGTVGSTGRSTGAHLHWGLMVHGESVDPTSWLGCMENYTKMKG